MVIVTVIQRNNNLRLPADEVLGPIAEDYILLQVIGLIDHRLLQYVKQLYQLKHENRMLFDIKLKESLRICAKRVGKPL